MRYCMFIDHPHSLPVQGELACVCCIYVEYEALRGEFLAAHSRMTCNASSAIR